MANKAHTATLNRIRIRYGVQSSDKGAYDIKTDNVIIEVETSASIAEAVERLRSQDCPVYIAVTNKEGIRFATAQVSGTNVGVMDPQGNVVLASGNHDFGSESV